MSDEIITRVWAMPSPWTFTIKPIKELLERYLVGAEIIVDPFCGKSTLANVRNDLAAGGEHAVEWLQGADDAVADVVLLDPPYSPRQVMEVYKSVGRPVNMKDTQTAKLYADCKRELNRILKPNGLAITFGWNSTGFGKVLGYKRIETMMVCHGGAHNDTIVVVERKP